MKFATSCIALIAAVSATEAEQYGHSDAGYGNSALNRGRDLGIAGHATGDSYGIHSQNNGYGNPSFGGIGSGFGGRGGESSGDTYGHTKQQGYGIYNFNRTSKTLFANDGYRVKSRSDPYSTASYTTYAKCVMKDPYEESYANGVLYLSQDGKSEGTRIWGSIQGAHYGELSINSLGDLREGCDSTGDVFNPYVSENDTTRYGPAHGPAPGDLGPVSGDVKVLANVDLSGYASVIGRSIVVTVPEQKSHHGYTRPAERVACCTIGLAAGPNGSSQRKVTEDRHYENRVYSYIPFPSDFRGSKAGFSHNGG